MHNRPLSLSPFGLVKPLQIKSAFHQSCIIVVFVIGTLGLSELVIQLDKSLLLLGSCCLLLCSGGEQIVSEPLLDLQIY